MSLPRPSIVVTEPEFGVRIDGRRGIYNVSLKQGSPSVSLYTLHARVSLTGRLLSWSGPNVGANFQPDHVGFPIAITGAGNNGEDFITTIERYLDGQTVLLAGEVVTKLENLPARLTWPCFLPEDVGKMVWLSEGAHPQAIKFYAVGALASQIARYESPSTVILADPITAPGGERAGITVLWGTDNAEALRRAGEAAAEKNLRHLYFPGSGLCCAFNLARSAVLSPLYPGGGGPPAGSVIEGDLSGLFARTIWIGENVRSAFFDAAANPIKKAIVPAIGVPSAPRVTGVVGQRHLPRFARVANPVVLTWGDSMSEEVVQEPQSAQISPVGPILRALQEANPSKRIEHVNRSIGGATFQWASRIPPRNVQPDWYSDPNASWESYCRSVPTSSGERTPDLVILAIGGGNDAWRLTLPSVLSVINKIRAWPKVDELPPDIIMLNCRVGAHTRDIFFGEYGWFQTGREFAAVALSNLCKGLGIGFLDYWRHSALVHDGYDPTRNVLINVPDLDARPVNPASPYRFNYRCRDYAARFLLEDKAGTVLRRPEDKIAFSLSVRADNVAVLGVDEAGALTVRVNSYGSASLAVVTVAAGSRSLRVTGEQAAECRYSGGRGNQILKIHSGAHFDESQIGKAILIPGGGYSGEILRTFILDVSHGDLLYLADALYDDVREHVAILCWGGALFSPIDADAKHDVVICGGGVQGRPLVSKVAEYVSPTEVMLSDPAESSLDAALSDVFIGRTCVPTISTPVKLPDGGQRLGLIEVGIRGNQLYVGYKPDQSARQVTAFRGLVERYGGDFTPCLSTTVFGPLTVRALNCWVDEPLLWQPAATDLEFWGVADPQNDYISGGNGTGHLGARQLALVDEPLMEAQDFTTGIGTQVERSVGHRARSERVLR
jgi:hypothetical protein